MSRLLKPSSKPCGLIHYTPSRKYFHYPSPGSEHWHSTWNPRASLKRLIDCQLVRAKVWALTNSHKNNDMERTIKEQTIDVCEQLLAAISKTLFYFLCVSLQSISWREKSLDFSGNINSFCLEAITKATSWPS